MVAILNVEIWLHIKLYTLYFTYRDLKCKNLRYDVNSIVTEKKKVTFHRWSWPRI